MADYEKLGLFYLGREYDLARGKATDGLLLYDSRDLVTHAVCVGMTGSGKTGLCLALLEEAALDGIPAIAIDPKGDLGNLLLTFPELRPQDFRPWISEDEAARQNMSADQFAAAQADLWRKGLADWQQDGGRIARLREAAEFAIYTPGSTAGIPLSILRSFSAPPDQIRKDEELLTARAATTTTGLLTLIGIDADPLKSREHILIATLLVTAWREGREVTLPALIQQIQRPPVARVGVVEMDAFFPEKERVALAMQINNLLASPASASWLAGDPLDVGALLHTATGKPRVAIISIAHLSDAERQFVVALVLNDLLGWMRRQAGTESLRAVFYMDEIAGYFPPVANPPTKGPLLTLLKQGRAFGVGAVLATQNPVDLDYKGLSNTGTWFVGRLQTERDRARVLDALEGIATDAGAPGRADFERMIGALGKRVFLMHNVHEKAPIAFQTRWTMSYLRGPLTREQIRTLMETTDRPALAAPQPAAAPAQAAPSPVAAAPPVAPGVLQYFLPAGDRPARQYSPRLYAAAEIAFADKGGSTTRACAYLLPISDGPVAVEWDSAKPTTVMPQDLLADAPAAAALTDAPPAATKKKNYDAWTKEFSKWVAQRETLALRSSARFGITSSPGENERDFTIRLQQAARERRDAAVAELRQKYAAKIAAQTERVRRAEEGQAREAGQATQQKLQAAVSFGATVLGAFLGRKPISATTLGRATTAARGVGRTMKEAQDVARAAQSVEAERQKLGELETELAADTAAITAEYENPTSDVQTVTLRPARGGVSVRLVALAWEPE